MPGTEGARGQANVPFWTRTDEVQLAWNEGQYQTTVRGSVVLDFRNPVPDPESSPVNCTWRILRYDGAHRLRTHLGSFAPMPIALGDVAHAELHSANLALGGRYVVQVRRRPRLERMRSVLTIFRHCT